jgi:hypothetical protein
MASALASEEELVFTNLFYEIRVLDGGSIVYITRTAAPFTTKEEIDAGCLPVQQALDRLGRIGKRLLVDTRLAVGNNDPSFEANFSLHRKRMASGFERVALLVQTIIGKLHNERLVQEDRAVGPRVFLDEDSALTYLREQKPSAARRVVKPTRK